MHYDVGIVGAGFAGLACARAAARRGLRVLVVDRKPAPGVRMHTTGLVVKEAAERWEIPAHDHAPRARHPPVRAQSRARSTSTPRAITSSPPTRPR